MRMPSFLKTTFKAWPIVFLSTIAICWLTEPAARHLFGIELPSQSSIDIVKGAKGWALVQLIASVVVLAPLLEELVFRFLLFKLPQKCGELLMPKLVYFLILFPILVAVASSSLFSFVHYIDIPRLLKAHAVVLTGWNNAFLALFFFGMAQCWLYCKTDRIWCPMLNHFLFNLRLIGRDLSGRNRQHIVHRGAPVNFSERKHRVLHRQSKSRFRRNIGAAVRSVYKRQIEGGCSLLIDRDGAVSQRFLCGREEHQEKSFPTGDKRKQYASPVTPRHFRRPKALPAARCS